MKNEGRINIVNINYKFMKTKSIAVTGHPCCVKAVNLAETKSPCVPDFPQCIIGGWG